MGAAWHTADLDRRAGVFATLGNLASRIRGGHAESERLLAEAGFPQVDSSVADSAAGAVAGSY